MTRLPRARHCGSIRATVRTPGDVALVARMVGWSLALPILKHVLPLPRLVRLMRSEPTSGRDHAREERIATIARWIYRLRPLASRDNCLERSLLSYRFLTRTGASPELVVAVGRDGRGVLGHVWVTVESEPVNDSRAALEPFAPIVVFGPDATARRLDRSRDA